MTLKETIRNAQDYTDRLTSALALDDMDLCNEILELRAPVMAAFEAAHRSASENERDSCQADLRKLAETDRKLQKRMAGELAKIAEEFRKTMGSNSHGLTQAYGNPNTQACVDRKA